MDMRSDEFSVFFHPLLLSASRLSNEIFLFYLVKWCKIEFLSNANKFVDLSRHCIKRYVFNQGREKIQEFKYYTAFTQFLWFQLIKCGTFHFFSAFVYLFTVRFSVVMLWAYAYLLWHSTYVKIEINCCSKWCNINWMLDPLVDVVSSSKWFIFINVFAWMKKKT